MVLRRFSPPSRIPEHRELRIREGCPRDLEIVGESRTSTLNERTRSWISPSLFFIAVGDRDQLTDKGEKAVEVV